MTDERAAVFESCARAGAGLAGSMFVLHAVLVALAVVSFLLFGGRPATGNAAFNATLVALELGLIVTYVLRTLYVLRSGLPALWNRLTYPYESPSLATFTYARRYEANDWWRALKLAGLSLASVPVVIFLAAVFVSHPTDVGEDGVLAIVAAELLPQLPIVGDLGFVLEYLPGRTREESLVLAVAAIPAAICFRNVAHVYERWIDLEWSTGWWILYGVMLGLGALATGGYLLSPGLPRFNSPAI
ncbi:hypothetical protein [Natrarchaeobius oligotrophus]|uniref:Uncharacterized protein n=1 Tax=Natrarchaeobius chitinivorans TaxID=1679083 RepID=A0A3N6PNR8_NATCH|nr:hypothetical protein [Natrarchaeobius chitinivorans]RQH03340.1 hypothetical protein EA472_01825 [Natrarchaeobius chitinivorans]